MPGGGPRCPAVPGGARRCPAVPVVAERLGAAPLQMMGGGGEAEGEVSELRRCRCTCHSHPCPYCRRARRRPFCFRLVATSKLPFSVVQVAGPRVAGWEEGGGASCLELWSSRLKVAPCGVTDRLVASTAPQSWSSNNAREREDPEGIIIQVSIAAYDTRGYYTAVRNLRGGGSCA